MQQLREQNSALAQQVQKQQALIESLSRQVSEIQSTQNKAQLQEDPRDELKPPKENSSFTLGKVNISGEGGVAFLRSGSDGMFPKSEFRLDEARLFLEAPVLENVFFYGELNLATREEPDVEARLGEAYIDIENISRLWGSDDLVNLRAGRMFIPFGEEYLSRYAIDNPFISHSLSDVWGVDEGLEVYGHAHQISYALAVQNGGIPDTGDFTTDKSVAGRVSFDPTRWLHLSASGMRTGDLDAHNDQLSALWFGNGFLRKLGSPGTSRFHGELAEADVQVRLPHGHLAGFGGYLHYSDNDPLGHNQRDVYYYSFEAVHDIIGRLYAGARFSQILAARGFPVVGDGDFGDYFFGPPTQDLWRLSLDVGYRWSQNLLLKIEYSFEHGKTLTGGRDNEDLFAAEAAFKF